MIAFLEAYRAGLFKRQHWLSNIISGIIVGVVALPLAMAFAIASGVKPEQGIYTAIVAGFLVSLFGGSRLQIAGPTGAFIIILAGITAKYGVEGLQIATLMAGLILLLLGTMRLGTIIKFIPDPVIVGFTSGIAVVIWVGQWRDFFGLPAVSGEHFHEKLLHLLQVFPQFNLTTTGFALFSLLLVLFSPRLPGLKRVPGPLVALVVATGLQALFHFEDISTIGSTFGGIPQGLPDLHWPEITSARLSELLGPAFAIAMLGAIESLLSAVVADGMVGTRHDSNQELIGQGIANIMTPLFGGFAATGAIARTATNIRNGGTSPLAGVIHAITLLLIIVFLAPLAAHVPLAVLAAILFVVAWNMSEAHHFIKIVKSAPRADVMILLATFGLTIGVDLIVAVYVGVVLAILQFLRRMASSVEVHQIDAQELHEQYDKPSPGNLPQEILIYAVEGPFFFGAVEKFERTLENIHALPKVLIIKLGWVPFIDVTGLRTLEDVILHFHKRQVHVLLTGANERVQAKLEKAGIIKRLGRENVFQDLTQALESFLPAIPSSPDVSAKPRLQGFG
ncbi:MULTISPECIES: SulP family inorganic anion transporter [unclassified Legionella]|uniref:SulP family inorganic anion transporter n=1 Tax=unclassified Legionella TaxID=2622702 RepID=UPI001056AC15|nr:MULTISPECIES: SulP family inorganic anion transporter [unclassified Legionella]MDI9818457.1 SulP family inorganic anion transporter [Legionella sp. PL877]